MRLKRAVLPDLLFSWNVKLQIYTHQNSLYLIASAPHPFPKELRLAYMAVYPHFTQLSLKAETVTCARSTQGASWLSVALDLDFPGPGWIFNHVGFQCLSPVFSSALTVIPHSHN